MQPGSYDETTIKDFLARMIDGWNHGDAKEFAATFSEGADFIAFEGTHLRAAMLNARRISMDQQHFLDQFVTLSAGEQREVKQRVTLMRH